MSTLKKYPWGKRILQKQSWDKKTSIIKKWRNHAWKRNQKLPDETQEEHNFYHIITVSGTRQFDKDILFDNNCWTAQQLRFISSRSYRKWNYKPPFKLRIYINNQTAIYQQWFLRSSTIFFYNSSYDLQWSFSTTVSTIFSCITQSNLCLLLKKQNLHIYFQLMKQLFHKEWCNPAR